METSQAQKLSQLQGLLRADPGNQRLARECIDLALQTGEYAAALSELDAVLAVSPADLRSRFDRATALIGQRQYAAAVEALRGIVRDKPDLTAAWINLGLCHYCLNEYGEARTALDAAYQAGDRSADLLRLLVSTYHHLGLINEAVALADANTQFPSPNAALAGVYALAYLDANQPSKAARWMGKALSANPDSIDGLTVQATLNAARMLTAHAKEQFERVLELAPNNGRAWIGLGAIALLSRDLPRARELLTRGVELMPRHVGSWHVLAWVNLLSGDLDAAQRIFEQSLELDRNFAETHGGLASVAALRGETAAAERGIKVALGLNSGCLSAQFARSALMARGGDAAGAAQLIKGKLRGLAPNDDSLLSRTIEAAAARLQ
jgi:tetratricopeptide (TPR) repeat protein